MPRLNFFRIHLLLFVVCSLIFSAILWASNGRFKINYVDALFLCVSSVTGTGLYTIDLSSLTAWQQTIMVILELIGNPVAVSWVLVYVRRRYFVNHLHHVIRAEIERTKSRNQMATNKVDEEQAPRRRSREPDATQLDRPEVVVASTRSGPGLVRRLDTAPRRIGAMDFVEGAGNGETPSPQHDTGPDIELSACRPSQQGTPNASGIQSSIHTQRTRSLRRQESDFGGFAGPTEFVSKLMKRTAPNLHTQLTRTITMPHTTTVTGMDDRGEEGAHRGATKQVPYISFNATVDRNSRFLQLTEDNLQELGGVEFRALNALLWIVPIYYMGILAVSLVVVAPYMSLSRWTSNFLPPQQHRVINPVWFSMFQVVAAWANTGMSLVDQNMIPFQTAYPMIFFLILCILAGNTAYPILLRFMIWILSKCVHRRSRAYETYQFLLDHPRRCFIYMFPSRQTWFLLLMLLFLNCTDWFFFLILDIGNPAISTIPVGTRIILGLLQACAVRTAGFQSVILSALAPAVKVLYLIMMYISVYPVAMSVRSTNVYEKQSLGIYDEEAEVDDDDDQFNNGSRVAIWGKYIFLHVRRQLAFDLWWLAFALFLLCIIEAHNLNDPSKATWFNIFQLTFELVSAYGTVGLSLGIPTANYSFAGALRTLSKLILCAVMLRGRHRGLPVALDRAVMLPSEFRPKEKEKEVSNPTDLDQDTPKTYPSQDARREGAASSHDLTEKIDQRQKQNRDSLGTFLPDPDAAIQFE